MATGLIIALCFFSESKTKSKKCCKLFSITTLLLRSGTLPLKSPTTLWKKHLKTFQLRSSVQCIAFYAGFLEAQKACTWI